MQPASTWGYCRANSSVDRQPWEKPKRKVLSGACPSAASLSNNSDSDFRLRSMPDPARRNHTRNTRQNSDPGHSRAGSSTTATRGHPASNDNLPGCLRARATPPSTNANPSQQLAPAANPTSPNPAKPSHSSAIPHRGNPRCRPTPEDPVRHSRFTAPASTRS